MPNESGQEVLNLFQLELLDTVENLDPEGSGGDGEDPDWFYQTTMYNLGARRQTNRYLPGATTQKTIVREPTSYEVFEDTAALPGEDTINVVIVCFACAVIVATIAFNATLLATAFKRRLYNEVSCQLAISQSCVDLLLAVVIMPIHFMVDLHVSELVMVNEYFCEFWSTADVFLCTLSILHQLGMCFDKYLTMRGSEFKHFRRRFVIYTVVFTTISAAVAAPLLFNCQTAVTATFVIASTTASFYIPTIIMLALIARISFHSFRLGHCKQCKLLKRAGAHHRHVVFKAITLHWQDPVVKRCVSLPFLRHHCDHRHTQTVRCTSGPAARRLIAEGRLNAPNPMADDNNYKTVSAPTTPQAQTTDPQYNDSSMISIIEEIEATKAALALPTRLPCTRGELITLRSKKCHLKPRTYTREAPVNPEGSNGFCYKQYASFSPTMQHHASTLRPKPKRSDNNTSSSTTSQGSNNQTEVVLSDKKPMLATVIKRKSLQRKKSMRNDNFLKTLQQKVCHQQNHRACYERWRAKALRTTISTLVCVTCWFPFFTLFVLYFVFEKHIANGLFRASLWLGYMNGILNPLLYILGKKRMRF